MRAVVQRVSRASVTVDGRVAGVIERGLAVLVGAARGDTHEDARLLADKVSGLRVFDDEGGRMNLALADVGGAVLAVPQFTLLGDCRRGRRPSFVDALEPAAAEPLFERFVRTVRDRGLRCEAGVFGATMRVALVNEGPVTLLVDTRRGL